MVLTDGDALYAGFVPGVVGWMVYWVVGLLHACTLANPALLSSDCFSIKAQVPLFHGVNNDPSQALPAHHLAKCATRQPELARIGISQPLPRVCVEVPWN
jgi:hypothetical protein